LCQLSLFRDHIPTLNFFVPDFLFFGFLKLFTSFRMFCFKDKHFNRKDPEKNCVIQMVNKVYVIFTIIIADVQNFYDSNKKENKNEATSITSFEDRE
jgi:hypothetical protein